MGTTVQTDVYLVIEPEHDWSGKVEGIKVDRITQGPPRLKSKEIAIHLALSMDRNVFEQFLPTVQISLSDPRQFTTPSVDVIEPTQPEPGDDPDEDTEGAGE